MLALSYNRFKFVVADKYAPLRKVVGRQLQRYFLSRFPGKAQPGFARDETQKRVAIGQLDPVGPVRERFRHDTFNFEGIFSPHVKISGSDSVMSTVCSKWADNEPSCVTTVQPSFKIFTPGKPALTIGSMAMVIPGRSFSERLPSTKWSTCGSSWTFFPLPWPTNSRTTLKPLPSP